MGLYLHVPFCHRICSYCDFAVTTARKYFSAYAQAVIKEASEVSLVNASVVQSPLATIYVGGGTPSFLPETEWRLIMRCVTDTFLTGHTTERTLEVNPSDVNPESANFWRQLGFNRLSLGVQSFKDDELKFLTRNHNAREAERAYYTARDAGFQNINLDLIFGLPHQSLQDWEYSLDIAVRLRPEHLSVYNLTVEDGTHLHKQVTRDRVRLPDDDQQLQFFLKAKRQLEQADYEHYEISNYARPGYRSVHNSAYWNGRPYLGLGPSAHSYDGTARWWNLRDVAGYVHRLQNGRLPVETREELTREQRMMERILLGLRQKDGLDIADFEAQFGCRFASMFAAGLEASRGRYVIDGHRMRLTPEGMFVTNAVCRSLTNCIAL